MGGGSFGARQTGHVADFGGVGKWLQMPQVIAHPRAFNARPVRFFSTFRVRNRRYTDVAMQIALKDFRAFQETALLEIRPLTFLIGENSSGKTSLLAALNYVWRFQERIASTSLNSPPFDLGTFDEIVHRVRGRTKPDCFQILIREHITIDPRRSPLYMSRGSIERSSATVELRLTFVNNLGDADIAKLELEYDGYILVVIVKDGFNIKVTDKLGRPVFDTLRGQGKFEFSGRIGRIDKVEFSEINFVLRRAVREASIGNEPNNNKGEPTEAEHALAVVSLALDQLTRTFPNSIFASAPVRSNPSRVYTPSDQSRTPDGTHTPQRLFKIKESDVSRWERIKDRIEKFGRMSGMFSAINVSRYRSSGSSPFHITVTRKGKQSNIVDVGYGVSQALPILTDLIEAPPRSGFLFQQPEVHLHPQAQAALGSFLVDYISNNRQCRIVAETHSDYLIDRVRIAIREGDLRPADVSLLYFETNGTATDVHEIEIDEYGNLENAPTGYREFFVREQMNLLGIDDTFGTVD
ncbi:MAG: DUF3696 domain-containing protein [Novosphingobium sp.]